MTRRRSTMQPASASIIGRSLAGVLLRERCLAHRTSRARCVRSRRLDAARTDRRNSAEIRAVQPANPSWGAPVSAYFRRAGGWKLGGLERMP